MDFDPAYAQLLDTTQEFCSELQEEISNNKASEKKIRSLIKEVEEYHKAILH